MPYASDLRSGDIRNRERILRRLDFEIEDRASRIKDRAKITDKSNTPVKNPKTCDAYSTALEVEADVFTDTTIVKVERNKTLTIFETDATTSAAIVGEVADRFNLDADDVEAVIDFELEDRASRASDKTVSSSTDCKNVIKNNNSSNVPDAELRARINQLQELINTLVRLLNLRLGINI